MILPSEMREILHALYPENVRAGLWWASFEMLRDLYQEYPDCPKVHEARWAMETAISEWSDDQVVDFVLNHLLEPPYSIEFQAKAPSELRQVLATVYRYLFDLPDSDD